MPEYLEDLCVGCYYGRSKWPRILNAEASWSGRTTDWIKVEDNNRDRNAGLDCTRDSCCEGVVKIDDEEWAGSRVQIEATVSFRGEGLRSSCMFGGPCLTCRPAFNTLCYFQQPTTFSLATITLHRHRLAAVKLLPSLASTPVQSFHLLPSSTISSACRLVSRTTHRYTQMFLFLVPLSLASDHRFPTTAAWKLSGDVPTVQHVQNVQNVNHAGGFLHELNKFYTLQLFQTRPPQGFRASHLRGELVSCSSTNRLQ